MKIASAFVYSCIPLRKYLHYTIQASQRPDGLTGPFNRRTLSESRLHDDVTISSSELVPRCVRLYTTFFLYFFPPSKISIRRLRVSPCTSFAFSSKLKGFVCRFPLFRHRHAPTSKGRCTLSRNTPTHTTEEVRLLFLIFPCTAPNGKCVSASSWCLTS